MKNNLLKNPILARKLDLKLLNPAGDLVEEINEQDIDGQAGGTGLPCITITVASAIYSAHVKNAGRICTLSAECDGGTTCD